MSDVSTIPRKRPVGISIIAVFLALSGFLALTGALLNFVNVSQNIGRIPSQAAALLLAFGVVSTILSLFSFGLTYGLWTLKRWAFWFTLALEAILIVQNVLLWYLHTYTLIAFAINTLPPLIIIAYLYFNREVRSAFDV